MAKKQTFDFDKEAGRLFKRTEQYADQVRRYYASAVEELLKIAKSRPVKAAGTFSFADNRRMSDKATRILRQLYSAVYGAIKGGVVDEWENANVIHDRLIMQIFGKGVLSDNHFAEYFAHNSTAVDAFFHRKSADGGLNLSQRVWKYVDNLKTEMEVALSVAIGEGKSADAMSRDVRKYLQNPDVMFRRFRVRAGTNEDGTSRYGRQWKRKVVDTKTSEVRWENFNPKDYKSGRGVYRSSYKNAMRLTRTETNIAYRTAEQDRWSRLNFVLGYRVVKSDNHPSEDICDCLSCKRGETGKRGTYPKDFVFKGWHPQCRCYAVPILASNEDYKAWQQAVARGEEPPEPSGIVLDFNKEFKDWIRDNKQRIKDESVMPYFIKDNEGMMDGEFFDRACLMVRHKAESSGAEVQSLAEKIAKRYNAICTPINFKSIESIKRKVLKEREKKNPTFSPYSLKDAVRTTIIADIDKIKDIISDLSSEDCFQRLKSQHTQLGYTGHIVNITTDSGLIAEIQINTARVIYAKERPGAAKSIIGDKLWYRVHQETGLEGGLGHKLYEQWRVLDPNSPEAKEIEKKSREYYSHFTH